MVITALINCPVCCRLIKPAWHSVACVPMEPCQSLESSPTLFSWGYSPFPSHRAYLLLPAHLPFPAWTSPAFLPSVSFSAGDLFAWLTLKYLFDVFTVFHVKNYQRSRKQSFTVSLCSSSRLSPFPGVNPAIDPHLFFSLFLPSLLVFRLTQIIYTSSFFSHLYHRVIFSNTQSFFNASFNCSLLWREEENNYWVVLLTINFM